MTHAGFVGPEKKWVEDAVMGSPEKRLRFGKSAGIPLGEKQKQKPPTFDE